MEEQPQIRAVDRLLMKAIELQRADTIGKALDAGASADLKVDGFPVLSVAAMQGNIAAVDELIRHGAYLDACDPGNRTPLMYVAMGGSSPNHIKAFDMLVSAGADVHQHDHSGRTAIDWAARFLNRPVAERLHSKGVRCSASARAWLGRQTDSPDRQNGR